jgi:hypothetical protein
LTECDFCSRFVVETTRVMMTRLARPIRFFWLAQQEESWTMEAITCNAAALCIAVIFYAWRDTTAEMRQRKRVLRERVAYMLWMASNAA